ncbi:hypothetical protein CHARACLAT_017733 [Characodon lateralis]|uniref:Uncharacterized protein n=1 Tax=Characodon lateralis TaxID=208331 RepID=A0ABU7CYI4_9TELE|nr:hypothetical protein [Characodon lateralis]
MQRAALDTSLSGQANPVHPPPVPPGSSRRPHGISIASLSQTRNHLTPGGSPHPNIRRLSWKLRSLHISHIVNKFFNRFSV